MWAGGVDDAELDQAYGLFYDPDDDYDAAAKPTTYADGYIRSTIRGAS